MLNYLKNPQKWEEIRTNPIYKPFIDDLWAEYDLNCRDKGIPELPFSEELEFIEKGTRAIYEPKYFKRRIQLCIYAMLCIIYPDRDDFLISLQDIIGEILKEYTWQVPAHRKNMSKRDGLSLFVCETGCWLAEIKQMLGDRLHPLLVERITDNLDWRVMTPFENEGEWLEHNRTNWASVCTGCIGVVFLHESTERFEGVRDRIDRCFESYLSGISDDGATPEGAGYWKYGFEFFVMYYDMLRRYDGTDVMFKRDKVRRFASFYSSMFLDEEHVVTFADCSSICNYYAATVHFLKDEYDIALPPAKRMSHDYERFSLVLRDYLNYNPNYMVSGKLGPQTTYYQLLQWYMNRTPNYSFAIKGGHNDIHDNHNHNDIGSFILSVNGKISFADLGCGQYDAENFGPNRYKRFNNSSLGHSVPIVNGCEQVASDESIGDLRVDGNTVSVDMSKAYGIEISHLMRTVTQLPNQIILKDEFDDSIEIKERFISLEKPVVEQNTLVFESFSVEFDNAWDVSINVQNIIPHTGPNYDAYVIDFKTKGDVPKLSTFTFKININ